ncbi:MAG: WecB/TagA/CpsF family glycosyltransferase [Limisphaerales bacterium]
MKLCDTSMGVHTDTADTQFLSERILGIRFFNGSTKDAVTTISATGGLLVVPAAPALVNIQYDAEYRRALVESDMAIADSGFMVLLWRFIQRQKITRISGLAYLKHLLELPQLRPAGSMFLVVPTKVAGDKAVSWLRSKGFEVDVSDYYVAPHYGAEVSDAPLVNLLGKARPAHVIVGLGGGVQEKLGLHLRQRLDYRPAIHCIGAALGFVTGDQQAIPSWADRFYLGWLVRLARNPRRYLRRFWAAHELPGLIWRYGSALPPLIKK